MVHLKGRRPTLVRSTVAVVSLTCLLCVIVPGAAVATKTAPPKVKISSKLFATGANLCKLIKTTAISKAVGVTFSGSVSKKRTCFWQNGKTVVRVSALPGLGKANVDGTVALARKSSATVSKAFLSDASEAYLVRIFLGPSVSESVYAVLPQGELLVNLSGPGLVGRQAIAAAKAALGEK
jgi:hypothetical protein